MRRYHMDINLDEKCIRCGQGGATPSGLCMKCIAKAIRAGELDHVFKEVRENHADGNRMV